MTKRLAVLTLYVQGQNMPEDNLGYNNKVRAVCLLNDCIELFTVYERTLGFIKKTSEFEIRIDLPAARPSSPYRLGKPFGRKQFPTLHEAVEFGKTFAVAMFPAADD